MLGEGQRFNKEVKIPARNSANKQAKVCQHTCTTRSFMRTRGTDGAVQGTSLQNFMMASTATGAGWRYNVQQQLLLCARKHGEEGQPINIQRGNAETLRRESFTLFIPPTWRVYWQDRARFLPLPSEIPAVYLFKYSTIREDFPGIWVFELRSWHILPTLPNHVTWFFAARSNTFSRCSLVALHGTSTSITSSLAWFWLFWRPIWRCHIGSVGWRSIVKGLTHACLDLGQTC